MFIRWPTSIMSSVVLLSIKETKTSGPYHAIKKNTRHMGSNFKVYCTKAEKHYAEKNKHTREKER